MLVLAGTVTFVVTHGDAAGGMEAGTSRTNRGKSAKEEFATSGAWQPESQASGARSAGSGKSSRPNRPRADRNTPSGPAAAELRTDLKVQVKPGHPRHDELLASASRVEAHALRQLAKLTGELDLTSDQQTRIFPILVRGAQSYDPGMQIVDGRGSNGSSKPASENIADAKPAADTKPLDSKQQQEALQEQLDLPQANALANLSSSDLMIWEELIDDLTRQLDQATPGQVAEVTPVPTQAPASTPSVDPGQPATGAGDSPATPAADPPTPPESHGGRNLFDLIPAE
ncbi:hypothetical protein [Luteolibacter soli]|uniref:Uncharacterized protein n=1 Tax=Luteolibacter soli TaxID=3135280 RepID=A0ABU9B3A4_9BACT